MNGHGGPGPAAKVTRRKIQGGGGIGIPPGGSTHRIGKAFRAGKVFFERAASGSIDHGMFIGCSCNVCRVSQFHVAGIKKYDSCIQMKVSAYKNITFQCQSVRIFNGQISKPGGCGATDGLLSSSAECHQSAC